MQNIFNDNIIYQNKNGIEYIQFKKLLQYPQITHCYTLRSGNKLNFPPIYKDEAMLKQSYKRICDCLNLDSSKIVKPHQTHTDNVQIVNEIKYFEEIDGLLTNKQGITLVTTSADCISLLIYDPVKNVVGSIHSGWKGTLKGIILKAIEKMKNTYGSNVKDIICCICPSIRMCCFEVDEDVKELFYEKYSNLLDIDEIIQKEGKTKYHIDTVKINIELLKNAGLKPENIIDSEICTMCHPKLFHSYRIDKENSGRNAALISILK